MTESEETKVRSRIRAMLNLFAIVCAFLVITTGAKWVSNEQWKDGMARERDQRREIRRRLNQEARQIDYVFANFIGASENPFVAADHEGKILYLNDPAAKLLDLSEGEQIESAMRDKDGAAHAKWYADAMERYESGELVAGKSPCDMRFKDGKFHQVEVRRWCNVHGSSAYIVPLEGE